MMRTAGLWMTVMVAACGGTPASAPVRHAVPLVAPASTPAATPHALAVALVEEPAAAEVDDPPPKELPQRCESSGDGICTPPAEFVQRLCRTRTPDLALTMFRKGTPWTRAYVRRDMEAWYVSGRPSSPKQVMYGEEVLIVANRAAPTGPAQMTGFGSYDVYRWDGTCVSVMADEVATRPLGAVDFARISWKHLDTGIQEALERNQKIALLSTRRRDACRADRAPEDCETAIDDLSRFIADYVRRGGEVPLPPRLP